MTLMRPFKKEDIVLENNVIDVTGTIRKIIMKPGVDKVFTRSKIHSIMLSEILKPTTSVEDVINRIVNKLNAYIIPDGAIKDEGDTENINPFYFIPMDNTYKTAKEAGESLQKLLQLYQMDGNLQPIIPSMMNKPEKTDIENKYSSDEDTSISTSVGHLGHISKNGNIDFWQNLIDDQIQNLAIETNSYEDVLMTDLIDKYGFGFAEAKDVATKSLENEIDIVELLERVYNKGADDARNSILSLVEEKYK